MAYYTLLAIALNKDHVRHLCEDHSVDQFLRAHIHAADYPQLPRSSSDVRQTIPVMADGREIGSFLGWHYDADAPEISIPPNSICVSISHNELGDVDLGKGLAKILNRYARPTKSPDSNPGNLLSSYIRDFYRPLYATYKNVTDKDVVIQANARNAQILTTRLNPAP